MGGGSGPLRGHSSASFSCSESDTWASVRTACGETPARPRALAGMAAFRAIGLGTPTSRARPGTPVRLSARVPGRASVRVTSGAPASEGPRARVAARRPARQRPRARASGCPSGRASSGASASEGPSVQVPEWPGVVRRVSARVARRSRVGVGWPGARVPSPGSGLPYRHHPVSLTTRRGAPGRHRKLPPPTSARRTGRRGRVGGHPRRQSARCPTIRCTEAKGCRGVGPLRAPAPHHESNANRTSAQTPARSAKSPPARIPGQL
ncbi:hypothetical protein GKJPGBOP_03361 [Streptomyces paromomycinus]|uniref:Uncharacterized protein n=1 Tax=Streptomyces paromomycinus TaxID=92743 RepID=A0A401W2X8_STREY|nr:hypothetical protein GKJPGBOP_03361 [Streptomyces paromomycinus]